MTDSFETGPAIPVTLVAEGAKNLGEVLHRRVTTTPDAPASFQKLGGRWQRQTWSQLMAECLRAAQGLVELGVGAGDRIAILGPTHIAWTVFDLGGHSIGATTLGIYPNQSSDQIRFLLEHSRSKVVFVAEEHELETVLEAATELTELKAIVPWSDDLAQRFAERDPRLLSPTAFRGIPMPVEESRRRLDSVSRDDIAILVYTSGTTGPPKGAMIRHGNILAVLESQPDIFGFRQDDLLLCFLPMAHVTERVLAFYCRVNTGVAAAYATSIGSVLAEIAEVRPTIFGSVPRLFEKAHAKAMHQRAQKPAPVRALFDWALGVGRRCRRLKQQSRPLGWRLTVARKVAHALVFKKVQQALGGRVRACLTGAAPISRDILEFFWAAGLPLLEAYGMTEATVVTHINRLDGYQLGSVGRTLPAMECRLADDGEILLRGPFVFAGYLEAPEATAEAVVDGWLHTGDIGTLDEDGFLRITDRKKHLIITAGGKNVAPANIERAIKSQSPLISHVHAHGDRRAYVTALIAPSPLETLEWGARHGVLEAEESETLQRELLEQPAARSERLARAMGRIAERPDFQALFLEPVQRGNRDLARVERVRRFVVLGRDFSQETGEMTPTMKLRRKVIESNYAELFDRLYSDPELGMNAEP